ncbi:GIY-YIG nuclease family protein [Aliivibrio fischeri]|uniref:GIY-YIG nuclease family protein n=1 Tax=Aliivibrio fischeri TaxID=668 RepID=UPI0007C4D55E|nr:GIY-YIG nuclease family protein [Aliivibrio fischeri]
MRSETLKKLYEESGLKDLFEVRIEQDYPERNYSAIRLKQNAYRLRAFELWENNSGSFFRIYHGDVPSAIKSELESYPLHKRSARNYSDFSGDENIIFQYFYELFSSDTSREVANQSKVYTRNSAYEGLALPDVDTSDVDVLGAEFTWKEIIAISEDESEDNELKKVLSQSGVYLQRSSDGVSRYVGSAYGCGGILGRWLKHLNSNGDAKHLNLYVLENGYNKLVFTVLEFTDDNTAIKAESRWKQTLGTKNTGPYDGFRLNRN